MRRKQAKKLRKLATAVATIKGENPATHYKFLKKVHKSLNHKEKQNDGI